MLWRRFRRHKRAFTLVELLVAIVIMSILAISVVLISSAASRTFIRGEETIAADDVKDIVMEYIRITLRNAKKVYLSNDPTLMGTSGTPLIAECNMLFAGNVIPAADGKPVGVSDEYPDGRIYPLGKHNVTVNGIPRTETVIGGSRTETVIGGYVYHMSSNVDGVLDWDAPTPLFGGTTLKPATGVYGEYLVGGLTFSPIERRDTSGDNGQGISYAVTVNFTVFRERDVAADGESYTATLASDVVTFLNLEQRKSPIKEGGKDAGDVKNASSGTYSYIFYS